MSRNFKEGTWSLLFYILIYGKLVKANNSLSTSSWWKTIRVDNNLKAQPTKFCKYVSSFRINTCASVQLDANSDYLAESGEMAEALAKHFDSVYNNFSTWVFHPDFMCNEF